ncbi:MAG: FlgD immunoglobulin-like domain containing protein [Candidatus Eisenbacteria bacterium]
MSSAVRAEPGWYPQTSPVPAALRCVDFVDPSYGWIGGSGGTILHTTDGGTNWVEQESGVAGRIHDIDFCDRENGYAAADQWTLLRTTNGGMSWMVVHQGDYESLPLGAISVVDSLTVWEAWTAYGYPYSGGGVGVTTDGGATWSRNILSWNDGHPCSVASLDVAGFTATTAVLSCEITRYDYSRYGLCFRTTDGCNTFGNPSHTEILHVLRFVDGETGFGGPLASDLPPGGGLERTTDGGVSWDEACQFDYGFHDVWFETSDLGWLAGDDGAIQRTEDGCSSWTEQPSGTTEDLHAIQFVDAWVGTAVGDNGTILHTVTGGEITAEVTQDAIVPTPRSLRCEPNPFTSGIRIDYTTDRTSTAQVAVFDAAGRLVRLLDAGVRSAGPHSLTWDGSDRSGRRAPAGTYFVRLRAEGIEESRTVLRIK